MNMKENLKKILAVLLCAALAAALAGCGGEKKAQAVNLFERLNDLKTTRTALDLPQVNTPIGTFSDGKADPALFGVWKTADGKYTYTYAEDGTATATMADSEQTKAVPFTCLSRQGYNILVEELELMNYDAEGNETPGDKQLQYSTYLIDGDAMYTLSVEDISEDSSSYYGTLQSLFRADEAGSIDSALAAHPVDPASFFGEWEGEKGNIVIDENGLTLDGAVYALSVNDRHQLVAEKDGVSTTYTFGVGYSKTAPDEGEAEWNEKSAFALNYTGADEADKPNLLPCLTDWAAEYGWEAYLYSASFTRSEAV